MGGDLHLTSYNDTLNCTNCTFNISKLVPHNLSTNCSALCVTSFVIIYVTIITTALCGNVLVLYAFVANKKLRQSAATYFIVSLAISDLFTASVVMPFDLEQILTRYTTWKHGALLCTVWTTLYLLMVPTSILNLLVLTIDRYKTLSDPLNRFKESPFMTKKKALLIITTLWVYCLLFALLPVMGWNVYNTVIVNGSCVFNISPMYSMLSSVLNFFIPLVSMCCLYFQIYRIAMGFNKLKVKRMTASPVSSPRSLKQVTPSKGMPSSVKIKNQKMLLRNTRAAKTVLVIVCTFVLCWIPHTVFSFVISAGCYSCFFAEGTEILSSAFLIMGYTNSALNPFLFGLKHRLFKKTFKMIFNKVLLKCQHVRGLLKCQHVRGLVPHRNTLSPSLNRPYRVTETGSVHLVQGSTNEVEPVVRTRGKNNFGASLVSIRHLNN